MAKRTKATATPTDPNVSIKQAFVKFVLDNNRRPVSAYELANFAQIPEATLYEAYGSVSSIEKEIWNDYFINTKNQIQTDPQYQKFSVREKLLAIYFTWFENLKPNRSVVTLLTHHQNKKECANTMDSFKESFKDFTQELIAEAQDTQEIESRPFITNIYPNILWGQAMFLLDFWLKDSSKNFEKTDAAIEKSVNLFFDLSGKTFIDSLFDFGKFVAQNTLKL